MALSQQDYALSMRTSRRSARGDADGLRSLLVHRLRPGVKAVLRLRLSTPLDSLNYRVHCEPCDRWINVEGGGEDFRCPCCRTLYRLEYAVFAAVSDK